MKSCRAIKRYEARQNDRIAKSLMDAQMNIFGWRTLAFPLFIYDYIRYVKRLRVLRKNLFFTKQMALEAAENIHQGKPCAWEIRQIEIKTREILDREKKGFYTEKIRSRQLNEITLLIDHYLELLRTEKTNYIDAVKAKHSSRGAYLSFLNKLQKTEAEVIQAAVTTMRKGTKKERRQWFEKVKEATKKIRMQDADRIYGE
jgi:hypothetical protein